MKRLARGLSAALAVLTSVLTRAEEQTRAPSGAAETASPAQAEFLKTNYVFNREHFDLALPRYEKLLLDYPEFEGKAMVHYAVALCHEALAARTAANPSSAGKDEAELRRRHLTEAVKALRSALVPERPGKKGPPFEKRREAAELLAQCLLELGQHEEAAVEFRALVDGGSPSSRAEAALGLADALFAQQDLAGAEPAYRRALAEGEKAAAASKDGDAAARLAQVRSRARFQLALCLSRKGGKESLEAARSFDALVADGLDPSGDALYMSALSWQEAGELRNALARFEKLASSPRSELREAGLFGAGTVLFQLQDYARADSGLDDLLQQFPATKHRPAAELYRGRALLNTGKLASGANLLKNQMKNPLLGEDASLWLARAYSSKDKHDSALKILQAALREFPDGRQREVLDFEVALELLADSRFEEAVHALRDFLQRHSLSPASDHASYLLAYAQHRAKKYGESLAACVRFLKDYLQSRFRNQVAQLEAENLFLLGRHDEAARRYEGILAAAGAALEPLARLVAEYRSAEAKLLAGKSREALAALDALDGRIEGAQAASHPVLGAFHFLRGEACYREGDYARAATELRAYLEPPAGATGALRHGAEARFKLASALQLSGDADGARKAYQAALDADPQGTHRVQISYELGRAAYESGDHGSAARLLETVVTEAPSSAWAPFALRYLAWASEKGGDRARASAYFAQLADEHREHALHAEALWSLALSLKAEGRIKESVERLRQLRAEHPGDERALSAQVEEATALARQKEPARALDAFAALRSRKLGPDHLAVIFYESAWCHRELGDAGKAAAAYRELTALDEAAAKPRGNAHLVAHGRLELAELEFDADRVEAAEALLRRLVPADVAAGASAAAPEVREKALYKLCWCYRRLGRGDDLVKTFRALRRSFADSKHLAEAAALAGRALLQARLYTEAADAFRVAIERGAGTPHAEEAVVELAECLNGERRFAEARAQLQSFLEKHAASKLRPQANFLSGWAAENLGDFDEAVRQYREAARPASAVAARAQFQIGQCLAARKQYKDAIVEFLQVPARFGAPQGGEANPNEWSARALLQVASCFEALEDYEQSRKYYDEVALAYPKLDEAKLAKERAAKLPR
jgi:TolA-binding protein